MVFLMRAAGRAPARPHAAPERGTHTHTRARTRPHRPHRPHTHARTHTHKSWKKGPAAGLGGWARISGGRAGQVPDPLPVHPPTHAPRRRANPAGAAATTTARGPPSRRHSTPTLAHPRTPPKRFRIRPGLSPPPLLALFPSPTRLVRLAGGRGEHRRGGGGRAIKPRTHATTPRTPSSTSKFWRPAPPPPPSGRLLELLFTPTSGRSARPGRRRAGSSPTRCRTRRQP